MSWPVIVYYVPKHFDAIMYCFKIILVPCLKMTASKVLGYGIILGSVMGRSSCFLVFFIVEAIFELITVQIIVTLE